MQNVRVVSWLDFSKRVDGKYRPTRHTQSPGNRWPKNPLAYLACLVRAHVSPYRCSVPPTDAVRSFVLCFCSKLTAVASLSDWRPISAVTFARRAILVSWISQPPSVKAFSDYHRVVKSKKGFFFSLSPSKWFGSWGCVSHILTPSEEGKGPPQLRKGGKRDFSWCYDDYSWSKGVEPRPRPVAGRLLNIGAWTWPAPVAIDHHSTHQLATRRKKLLKLFFLSLLFLRSGAPYSLCFGDVRAWKYQPPSNKMSVAVGF